MSAPHACHEAGGPPTGLRWYRNKLLWVSSFALILCGAGFFAAPLRPFQDHFLHYLRMIWWALGLGFVFAGIIDRYIPPEYISKILARPRKRTILYATGLGLILSACSHGILAVAVALHKKGASGPAVIAFLLGSPWANLPVTFLLVGLFHLKGILIIASALIVSLTTGLLFMVLDKLKWIEANPATLAVDADFSILADIRDRWRGGGSRIPTGRDVLAIIKGAARLADMILWWIVLGIILAGLVGAYVPPSIFQNYLGPTFTGLLLTLAAATVIEICSEGSAPLAFEVYRQTGSIGNTFAFLMGGFVTDYTEVGLVWQQIGRRTALWMVGLTVPQVLLLGWIYNQF